MLISQFAEHTGAPVTTLPWGLLYPVPVIWSAVSGPQLLPTTG